MAKNVWSLVRLMLFMLKKGISKRKFLVDVNMMMKRGKIAGKAFHNLIRHHNSAASTSHRHPHHLAFPATPPAGEYEFSCSNTPPYPLSVFSTHKKHQNKCRRSAIPNAPLAVDDCDEFIIDDAVLKVLNLLTSTTASPPLNTTMVEHMRITDSPLPVSHGGEDGHVDEAAENFIRRFYNDRRRES